MRVLVLGGTRFLGRALVDALLEAGHQPTLFNRGQTGPKLFPDVEQLRGDRSADLSALEGREWDAVLDVAAYMPDEARRARMMMRRSSGPTCSSNSEIAADGRAWCPASGHSTNAIVPSKYGSISPHSASPSPLNR